MSDVDLKVQRLFENLSRRLARFVHPRTRLSTFVYVTAIAVALFLSWLITRELGGAGAVAPHWVYIPIMLAAYRFGFPATLLVSLIGAFLVGPIMPDHFTNGVAFAQPISDWLSRSIDFAVLGQIMALLFLNLRTQRDRARQALYDPLTGLPNRVLFHDRLDQALRRLERTGGSVGVLYLDLDNFKTVNDGHGHAFGDALLQTVASRLSDTCGITDNVGRLGGDEFGLLIEDENNQCLKADELAERVIDALRFPYVIGHMTPVVTASVGLATTTDSSEASGDLLHKADMTMYVAKAAGKDRLETYHDEGIPRPQLEAAIGGAVDRGELAIDYQPIFDLTGGNVIGVEALLRWDYPEYGFLLPASFIPAAEMTGHIVVMGDWALRTACHEIRALHQEVELPNLRLSVNLSALQLEHPGFVEDVATALRATGFPADLLTLEITESVAVADAPHSLTVLEQLKALGVGLAIDDFGTGYSSLAYLRRMPVDELKIDSSFIIAMEDDSDQSTAIVKTIVTLAKTLGLRAVGEGIETREQLHQLRRAGCELAQGFALAKPMNAASLRQFLTSATHPASAPLIWEPNAGSAAPEAG